jgi:hypothetical protein
MENEMHSYSPILSYSYTPILPFLFQQLICNKAHHVSKSRHVD